MSAGNYNFEVEQFSALKKKFVYKDSLGALVDLSGYSAKMQIRKSTGELLLDLTTENDRIVIDGTAGEVLLQVQDEDMGLSFSKANYDLVLTPPDGFSFRWLEGTVSLSKGVTQ